MISIINGQYRLKHRIGAGSFGEVYEAEDLKQNIRIGLKIEIIKARYPQLENESAILQTIQGGINYPRYIETGVDAVFRYLAMELLGKNLDELFILCGNKFTIKTVLMIADQLISSLEFLHKRHYIFRDIKPNNFVIGRGSKSNQIFMVDFGLCKKYIDEETSEHVEFLEGQSVAGTVRFASKYALAGNTQSRRDDMIALGYLLIYFAKGTLPWAAIEANSSSQKIQQICTMKSTIEPEELCNKLPPEFRRYLVAVSSLEFAEEPKYSEYRQMFRNLLMKYEISYDYKYDWSGMPQLEPALPTAPKNKSSSRRPPVSARLLPPTPLEKRMMHLKEENLSVENDDVSPEPRKKGENFGLYQTVNRRRTPRHSVGPFSKFVKDSLPSLDHDNMSAEVENGKKVTLTTQVRPPPNKKISFSSPRQFTPHKSSNNQSDDENDSTARIHNEKCVKLYRPNTAHHPLPPPNQIFNQTRPSPISRLPAIQMPIMKSPQKSVRSQSVSSPPPKETDILPKINRLRKNNCDFSSNLLSDL